MMPKTKQRRMLILSGRVTPKDIEAFDKLAADLQVTRGQLLRFAIKVTLRLGKDLREDPDLLWAVLREDEGGEVGAGQEHPTGSIE